MTVRVRIAPSPTGDPHVGTAYIALFNYVLARKNGGQFVLRIEDTDRARSRPEWETMIFESLRWLGLEWDEGPDKGGPHAPYRQSERGAIYAEHAEILLQKGAAYRCFCTAERLAEVREKRRKEGGNAGYDGHCRNLDDETVKADLAAQKPFTVRLRVADEGQTVIQDALRGAVEFDNAQVDDQVLLKSDGMPTYHLANVVDDHVMEITHVIRAEEWITSTPKHVMLYEAFGWELPTFIHMPLLRNQDKSKISKRKNPVSVNYYRDAGYLPDAMLNYLAMMGWSMPDEREKFSLSEMIDAFDWKRISLGGPVFDVQKLTWLNGVYLREQEPAVLAKQVREQLLSAEVVGEIMPLVAERIDKLEDFVDYAGFFFTGDVTYNEEATKALVPKGKTPKEAREVLAEVTERIDALPKLTTENGEAILKGICEEKGLKVKEVFMPVRVAVTGKKATPPLFESMEILGKERCRRRLRGAIAHLKQTH